jgi:hypothetical protein
MKIETINALINSLKSTADDDRRYSLSHVLIESYQESTSTISITATNGHYLTQILLVDDLIGHIPKHGMLISNDEIKKLKALKIKSVDSFKIDGDTWIVNGCAINVIKNSDSDSLYPKYQNIIPEYKDDDCMELTFNAEYLESMLAAMRDHKRQCGVTLKFLKSEINKPMLKPILVTVSGVDSGTFGVLMPMKK